VTCGGDGAERFDVVIVGAGLSGIGAGYRLQTECPQKSFVILEGRSRLGGTWDLFRYPGVRSDSDMFTLGYPFRPWTGAQSIAGGRQILGYLRDTAAEYGIDRRVRFGHKVVSAAWSSEEGCWRLEVESGARRAAFEAGFLYLCSGYFSYEHGHEPEFPGREDFRGELVHPQSWPDDLNPAGKKVVVIGSGATAVTLVPALAETADHVTMLQRSPTYMVSLPSRDPVAEYLSAHLSGGLASRLTRWKNVFLGTAFYQFCRRRPARARALLAQGVQRSLPGYDVDPDFVPKYDPWDQRLCLVPDGDFFAAVREGRASVVTDHVARFIPAGVKLQSGRVLEADVIVSATGLELVACGGIALEVDGEGVSVADTMIYRGFMLSGVPNLAFAFGYTNASFTLRSDLSSRAVCRVVNFMDEHDWDRVVPVPAEAVPLGRGAIDLTSGYVARAADRLPKQGSVRPWRMRQNYVLDFLAMKFGRPTVDLSFSKRRPVARREPTSVT
jgi:monooxygenase